MSKSFSFACAYVCAASLLVQGFADDVGLTPKEVDLTMQTETENRAEPEKKVAVRSPVVKAIFSPFTGKVKGEKVRLRLNPDLESHIVREMHKNDLLSVVGEEGNFWCVQAPEGVKAYIFRSFVLDNVVEGSRVNVRLEPDLEAPIVGHLNAGDRVQGAVVAANKKWLEIAPPPQAKFYIAKELVEFAGGPDLKTQVEKRKAAALQLLDSAVLVSKAEFLKPFDEVDFDRIKRNYLSIVNDYKDFPEYAEKAKEALTLAQETYLQKRISHLETKAVASSPSDQAVAPLEPLSLSDRMKMWEPIEEALYMSWSRAHHEKNLDEYYDDQKMASVRVSGILEAFAQPIKNKPGDYVLKEKNLPVAYVYSTQLDLHDYVGKKVTLVGAPRSNHNFAYPAYYVLSVE